MVRPIAFFVHHQGRGHAKRCEAILEHLSDRPITIMSASRDIFGPLDDRVRFVALPDAIGDPSATAALHAQQTPDVMQCVPLGSRRLKRNAEIIVDVFRGEDPSLFVNDVSVEWALLSRLCSVPCVKVRMHGERSDASHTAAYQASAGMIAPFDERLEQDDYPAFARRKTFYAGGLCPAQAPVPTRQEARRRLGVCPQRQHIVVLSGGGGAGANYASLTMAARALPDALWTVLGPTRLEGHETDFANLARLGWVDNALDHLASADLVVASAGDTTVHEIARVGRPYLCIPEWRYYDEQSAKAQRLAALGAAHVLATWPASNRQWQDAVAAALLSDVAVLRTLYAADAAERIAHHLAALEMQLWAHPLGPVVEPICEAEAAARTAS